MLSSDAWQKEVVRNSRTFCPACRSLNLTMGACAVGSITIHQEYVCEDCQYEFSAFFALVGCYQGRPEG